MHADDNHSHRDKDDCSHVEPRWPYGGRGHRDPRPGSNAVDVSGLQVRYPGSASAAITNVSCEIPCGQRVALIGHNGAIYLRDGHVEQTENLPGGPRMKIASRHSAC